MKILKVVFSALTLVCLTTVAQAQDQTVSASDTSGAAGASVDVVISLDSAAGDIQGWSWGVENDESVAMVTGVADGSATATVGSGGGAPAFNTVNLVAGGWTVGVVIDFLGCCTLAPGTGLEMEIASYDLVGAALDSTTVCFVDTLGTPAVATVVVISGASVPPATACGSITIDPIVVGPEFTYTAGSIVDLAIGSVGPADVSFSINTSIADDDAASADNNTQGFSMGLGNGPELACTGIASINDLAGLNGGTGPSFFGENLLADGWTVGVVYNFLGGVFLDFSAGADPDVIQADYDATGVNSGDVSDLTWLNTLGTPAVANVVVVGGQSIDADFANGSVSYLFSVDPSVTFIRGDANNDSIVNIADGIFVIGLMFYGYTSVCEVAGDANFDGMVDLADAVHIIEYRFSGGAAPAAPFPDCGDSLDAGDVALGCAAGACP